MIRNIQESDLNACANLFAKVFSSEPWREEWNVPHALERLTHFYKSLGFYGVLAEQSDIVGFALGNIEPFNASSIFYLREMCVETNLQNKGIGEKILQGLEEELYLINVQSIYLATEKTIPAAKFYEKNGFNQDSSMAFYEKVTNS